ncbi:MAG: GntR family transcriptional regulator [Desulfarculaceae bacterium]|nr:GntR family transcriptional regulator [Desulfarculaceae bacterium]
MSQPLKRNTLKEQAYLALREMIAGQRFSSGTWINAELLAKELGVSRTPVWQALKQLEAEGLVQHVPNRGVRMVEMTPEMAVDLYEVRGVLEALAARLMAREPSAKALARMEKILSRQERSVAEGDSAAYSRTDFEFHQVLYEACGNWLLREQLDGVKSKARPFVRDISPILPELYQDHHNLILALKACDEDAAAQAMMEHNRRVRRLVERTQLGRETPAQSPDRAS